MHEHVIWDTVKSWSPRGDFCCFRKKMVIWDVIFIVALLDFISLCVDLIFTFFANNFTSQKKNTCTIDKLNPALFSRRNFLNCKKKKKKKDWCIWRKIGTLLTQLSQVLWHMYTLKNPNSKIFWKLNSPWKWLYRMSYFSQIN